MAENVSKDLTRGSRAEQWRDAVLISLAVLCLLTEVVYLLHLLKIIRLPLPWERSTAQWRDIGKVAEKRNQLKSRGDASLTWFPLGQGERVHLHDSVLTGPDSSARLEIEGQGEILLESNTLVRFAETAKDQAEGRLSLDLAQGLVRVRSKTLSVPLHLRKHRLLLGPDTELVLSKPPLVEQSQLQVRSGEVKVISEEGKDGKAGSATDSLILKKGEAIQVQSERGLARLETSLNIDPKYPVDRARLFAKGNVESIGIYWSGEEASEVEISREPDFLQPRRLRTAGRSVQAELVAGKYYWRVRRDIAVSGTKEFTLMPPVTYKLLSPAENMAVKEGSSVELKWEAVPDASHYLVEISRTEEFKDYLLQSDVTDTSTKLPSIQAGTYFWRVRAVHPEWGPWAPSPVQNFQAKRKLTAPKPKGAKMIPGTQSSLGDRLLQWILPLAHAAEDTVWMEFEWEATEGAAAYRLEIFSHADRRDLLQSIDIQDTQAHVELPRREEYFWRVAAIDEGQLRHLYSQLQRVQVTASVVSAPTENQIASKNFFPIDLKKKTAAIESVEESFPGEPVSLPKTVEERALPNENVTEEGPSREIASERRTGWLPNAIAVGIGGQAEIETAQATDFDAQSTGAAQFFGLEIGRRQKYRLRAEYRKSYVGETVSRPLFERFAFEAVAGPLVAGLSLGLLGREELQLKRVDGDTGSLVRARAYGLQIGKIFETGRGKWRGMLETWVQGFPLGDLKGVGAVAEAGVAYAGFRWLIPELFLRFSPRLMLGVGQRQWTAEALAFFRLRIALEASGSAAR